MKNNHAYAFMLCLTSFLLSSHVHANSVSFDSSSYAPNSSGQITVTVSYDFTDFGMFGGGINLVYNAQVLEFVSYTQSDLSDSNAQAFASPIGGLASAGLYEGFGIGTEFFLGIQDSHDIGTFVFNVIDGQNGFAGCGDATLCLTPHLPTNPMVSLFGDDVTDDVFASGLTSANVEVPVPLPAALWLLLSGIGLLVRFGRNTE